MACECEVAFLRTFPGKVKYSVSFAVDREAAPVQWSGSGLTVCIRCGEVSYRVPDDVLDLLREGAGEL